VVVRARPLNAEWSREDVPIWAGEFDRPSREADRLSARCLPRESDEAERLLAIIAGLAVKNCDLPMGVVAW